ncbi:MAG: polymerase subunit sigma-24 [Bacteroidota bacterium]|nr:polymerase subunit sigma-24 [Bacteroidota bacterium]
MPDKMNKRASANLDPSDTEIIQKILNGEKLLFELLMRRTNSALYKVGRSYGFGHEDIEDLMQDTHVTAYMNLSKFENRSQYKTWVIKIMLNKCLYKMSKMEHKNRLNDIEKIKENAQPMFTTSINNDTEKQVLNHELSNALEKSIEAIPLEYRTVFILREKEGLSITETAGVLDITESNVKVRLNRAKVMLRQKIEDHYANVPVYEFNLVYCDKIVNNVLSQLEKEE